jgi:hypothetical protein
MEKLVVNHDVVFTKGSIVSWLSPRWKEMRFGRVVDIRPHSTKRHPNTERVVIAPFTRRHQAETNPAVVKYKVNLWSIPSVKIQ